MLKLSLLSADHFDEDYLIIELWLRCVLLDEEGLDEWFWLGAADLYDVPRGCETYMV
jgi:hypothetical protein